MEYGNGTERSIRWELDEHSDYFSVLYEYSKTCLEWPLSKRPQIGFQDQLSFNVGQKYWRMLQGETIIP